MLKTKSFKICLFGKYRFSNSRVGHFGFICFFLFVFFVTPTFAQSKKELSLKIAYVSKIVGLIRWGPDINKETKWVYGVLSDEDSFNLMTRVYTTKKIKNKIVTVTEVTEETIDSSIDVLYVGKYYEGSLEALLQIAQKHSILVITSNDGFGVKGSHINFFFENKKLRFEINLVSLRKAQLDVNSFLLNYAKIVGEKE